MAAATQLYHRVVGRGNGWWCRESGRRQRGRERGGDNGVGRGEETVGQARRGRWTPGELRERRQRHLQEDRGQSGRDRGTVE